MNLLARPPRTLVAHREWFGLLGLVRYRPAAHTGFVGASSGHIRPGPRQPSCGSRGAGTGLVHRRAWGALWLLWAPQSLDSLLVFHGECDPVLEASGDCDIVLLDARTHHALQVSLAHLSMLLIQRLQYVAMKKSTVRALA